MSDTLSTAQQQERVTYEAYPCPKCGEAMTGARVFDPKAQEAFVGAVCVPCDMAFRVVRVEGVEPERVVVLTERSESEAKPTGPAPDGDPEVLTPQTEGEGT